MPTASIYRTVDLREITQIISRRRWIVVGTVATLVCLAAIFIFLSTTRYTATATVLIDPRRSHVADYDNQPLPSNFGTDDAMVESQVLLIQSVAVLQRVVNNLKLADDPEFGPHPSFFSPILDLFSGRAIQTAKVRDLSPNPRASNYCGGG